MKKPTPRITIDGAMAPLRTTTAITIEKRCPTCNGRLAIRKNRETGHGFIGCSRWPECSYTQELPLSLKKRLNGDPVLPGFE